VAVTQKARFFITKLRQPVNTSEKQTATLHLGP
jgi:hypothetical protein